MFASNQYEVDCSSAKVTMTVKNVQLQYKLQKLLLHKCYWENIHYITNIY